MQLDHLVRYLGVFILGLICCGCSSFSSPAPSNWFAGGGSAEVGTAEWWKKNRRSAVFVPGKGYEVAGVDGYFDGLGRPIDSAAPLAATNDKPPATNLIQYIDPFRAGENVEKLLAPTPNEQLARQLYAEGEEFFRKEEYGEAAEKFMEAAERLPDSSLEQDALFKHAESLYFAEKYPKALDRYAALLEKYPATRHLDNIITRQFNIARTWQKYAEANGSWWFVPNFTDKSRRMFDTRGHAIKAYENIWLNDPTGPLADDSLMATANTHFLAGRYDDADYYYGLLRKEYPQSEHQYAAHLLGLQAKLHRYQGSNYDGYPLEEADQLCDQLLRQFPDKINEDRDRVVRLKAEVRAAIAHRDWDLAEYYASRDHYGSARYYYAQIVNDFPDTQLAQAASQRIKNYEGEPDVPSSNLEWIAKIIPDRRKTVPLAAELNTDTTRR